MHFLKLEYTSASSVIAILSSSEVTFTRNTISLSNRPTFRSSSNRLPPSGFRCFTKTDFKTDFASCSHCVQSHVRDPEEYVVGGRDFPYGGDWCGGRTKPTWCGFC